MRKEQEIAHEISASENEVQKNAMTAEATRAKGALGLPEQAVASTNNSDAHNMADKKASDCNAPAPISIDTDMTVDLIDFTDSVVELADCRESDQGDDCLLYTSDAADE